MKRILLIIALSIPTFIFAQITFTDEVEISDNTTGYGRPRLTLTANDIPLVIWFKEGGNQSVKISRGNGDGTFSVPTDVITSDFEPTGFIGPEIAAKGDTVYIAFICGALSNNTIMIKKSFDGGLTFSDTIRVSPKDNNYKYAMPNVAVMEDGNPVVTYMRSSSTWTDWEQMVNVSTDFGLTFPNEVDGSALAPGEPCDCCKSSVVTSGDNVYLIFRNDESNIRNMYISKSSDGGISFDSAEDLDDIDWIINSCPTSSGYGVVNGDSILIVRRNGGTGVHQLYFSNVDKNTLQKEYYTELSPIGTGLQDKPAVAGDDNVVGVVWQDSRSGNNSCYFSYSTNGAHNLGSNIEMSDSTAFGHKTHADIEYSNGIFYFVYRYNSGHSIMYKEFDLSGVNAINIPTNTDKTLLKTTDLLGRESNPKKNSPYLNIYNDGTVEKRVVIE